MTIMIRQQENQCPASMLYTYSYSNSYFDFGKSWDELTEALDVILELPLLLGAVDAGQVHAVEPAVLLRLVPVGLQRNIERVGHQ